MIEGEYLPKVTARPNILENEVYLIKVPTGSTIASILGSAGEGVSARLNCVEVPKESWDYVLREDDTLFIYAVPQGDSSKNILGMIAIAAISFYVPYALAGASWAQGVGLATAAGKLTLAGHLLSTAIIAGASYLINSFIAPHVPNEAQEDRDINYLSGSRNRNPIGNPIPKVYGTFRYFPPLASSYYTLNKGEDQYLYLLFCLGYDNIFIGDKRFGIPEGYVIGDQEPNTLKILEEGEVVGEYYGASYDNSFATIWYYTNHENGFNENIEIGGTSLSNFSDYELEIGAMDAITIYDKNIHQQNPSRVFDGAGDSGGGWQEQNQEEVATTPPNTTKVSIDLTFTRGLYTAERNGRKKGESDYREETYNVVPGLTNTRWISLEWPAVDFFVYYAPKGTDEWTLASTEEHLAGVYNVYRKWLGGYYNDPYTTSTDPFYYVQAWRVKRNTLTPFTTTFEFDVPKGEYDIKIVRYRTMRAGTQHYSDATWTALRSTLEATDKPFTVDNTVMLAMKIKATDQFNGVIDNLSIEVKGHHLFEGQDYDTSNPAYAFLATLTGQQMQHKVPIERIDMDSIEEWATFCTDNNIQYNAVHDKQETVIERLRSICATGFASLSFIDGKFGVILDTNFTPFGLISPRNSWGYSSTKSFRDEVQGVRVKYIDNKTWEEVDRLVPNNGYRAPEEDNELPVADAVETLETFGITSAEQAWKYGKYHLSQYTLRPETYSVSMGIENIHFTRGDVVNLAYDTMLVGQFYARVSYVESPTRIQLDQKIVLEEGLTYVARVRLSDGTTQLTYITLDGDTLVLESQVTGLLEGDLIVIGEAGAETVLAKVLEISPSTDMTASITLVDAAPNIFDAWAGNIPDYNPKLSVPIERRQPPAAIVSLESDYSNLVLNRDGSVSSNILLNIKLPFTEVPISHFRVTLFDMETTGDVVRREMLPSSTTSHVFTGLKPDNLYSVDVITYSIYGRSTSSSPPSYYITTADLTDVTNFSTLILPTLRVSGLELKGQGNETVYGGRNPEFQWRQVSAKNIDVGAADYTYGEGTGQGDSWFRNYVVRIYNPDGSVRREDITREETYTYDFEKNVADGAPARDFTIKIWAEGIVNQVSEVPAVLSVTNPLPTLSTASIRSSSTYNSVTITYNRPSDIDYAGVVLFQLKGTAYEAVYYGDDASITIGDLEPSTEYSFKIAPYDVFSPYNPDDNTLEPYLSLAVDIAVSTSSITSDVLDTTPPSTPQNLVLSSQTFQTTNGDYSIVSVSWDASQDSGNISHYLVTVDEDGGDVKEIVADNTFTTFNAIANRTYHIVVRAVDWAGNRSGYSDSQSIVAASDSNAPSSVTNLAYSTDINKIILTWKNPSDIDFDKARVKVNDITEWEGRGESFVHYLAAGSSAVYSVTAIDYSGNESLPQSITGTSESINSTNISTYFQDGVSPVVSLSELPTSFISDVISYNSTLYRWDGTHYISTVEFSDIDNVQIASSQFEEGIEPVTIVDTLPVVKVTQAVFLTSDSKIYRWNGSSYINTVFVNDLDTTPPSTPSNLSLSTSTLQTTNGDISLITATWDASVDNEGVSHYVLNVSESGGDDKEIVADGTSTVFSAIAGRTYTATVKAVDCFGNKSLSSSSESIVAATDSNPPSPVTGLSATSGLNTITLNWTNPTDIDYKETFVRKGSTIVWRGRGTSFVYATEPSPIPIVFEVFAVDYSGNQSPVSYANANSENINSTNISDFFDNGVSPVSSPSYLPTSQQTPVITYNGDVYRWNGSGYTKEVAFNDVTDVVITSDLFASDIEPLTVVDTLPTSKVTEAVFLSSDKKIYRWDGSAYIRTTPFSDLEGYISASQIEANSISTNRLTADWLEAGAIAAGAISANELNVDSVLANAILAQNITATGTITGATLQTSVSGSRIVMDDNGIVSYNSSGAPVISILTNGSVEMGKEVQYAATVPNPSFTDGFTSWTVVSDNGSVTHITNDGYSDSYCVQMQSNNDSSFVEDGVYIVGQEGIVANGNFQMSFRPKTVGDDWARVHIGVLADDGNGTQVIFTQEYTFISIEPFELITLSFDIKDHPEFSGVFDNPSFKIYPLIGNSRTRAIKVDDVSLNTQEIGGIKLSSDGSIGINLAGEGVFTTSLNGGRVEINPKNYQDAIVVYDDEETLKVKIDGESSTFLAGGTNGAIYAEGHTGILSKGQVYAGRFEIPPESTQYLSYAVEGAAYGGDWRTGGYFRSTDTGEGAYNLFGVYSEVTVNETPSVNSIISVNARASTSSDSTAYAVHACYAYTQASGTASVAYGVDATARCNSNVTTAYGVRSRALLATVNYDFYAAGTGTYSPFTGSHDGLISKSLEVEVGDIVADTDKFYIGDISNTISVIRLAGEKDKGVIGVYVGQAPIQTGDEEGEGRINALKNITPKEYEDLAEEYNIAIFNALGEGMLNVCGWNGDIEAGDLIVASPITGKGMKQEDDIIRGYTVAKARQGATFTDKEEVKMIPCIYLCG